MNRRRTLGYGLLAALAATALAALSPPVFSFLDLRSYDALLRASKTGPPSGRLSVVVVDDRSLKEVGQWPWGRDVIGRLVRRLRGLGADVIALDLLLAEPDRFRGPGNAGPSPSDAALAAAVTQERVVVGYAMTFGPDSKHDAACVLHSVDPIVVDARDQRATVDQLFQATGVVCSLPELSRAAGASGFLNASADRDGLLRRIPLLMTYKGHIYPSLAFAAATSARGSRLLLTATGSDRSRLTINGVQVPLDARGTLLIRFRGGRGTYGHVSAADVLYDRLPAHALKGRIVFVGATALGVQDVMATPVDGVMPGIEVHAAATDTLLQGDFVATPAYWRAYELGATLALSLAAAGLLAVAGLLPGALLAVALVAAFWWATFIALNAGGVYLSPVFPTLGVTLALSVLTVTNVRHERRRANAEQLRRERAHRFVTQSLTSLMETRDAATGQHARRTQEYSRVLATKLAELPRFRRVLTPDRVDLVAELSPLHDIGKVGVRDAVLNKPGALSADELDEMRRHPIVGHDTLERAERLAGGEGDEALVQLAKDIVYTHHERWDGRGYPRGLKGDEIPVAGRIVALVDVYDALSNPRAYHSILSHEEAVSTIVAGRGTHFDPDVVDAFLATSEQFRHLSLVFRSEEAADDRRPA